MDFLEDFFGKIPNWLRYLLFIPAGFLSMFFSYILMYITFLWYFSPDSGIYIFLKFITVTFVELFAASYVMYKMIPNHKYTIMVIIISILTFLYILSVIANPSILINAILYIAGMITGLIYAKEGN